MTFTSRDVADNKELKNFLRTRVKVERTKLVADHLLNVYDTRDVIRILQEKIDKYKHGGNVAKYIPRWEQHIKYLKGME